jgi:hypothetical protein
MTVLKNRPLLEGLLAKVLLTNVYRQELELLARMAKHSTQAVEKILTNHVQTRASK